MCPFEKTVLPETKKQLADVGDVATPLASAGGNAATVGVNANEYWNLDDRAAGRQLVYNN